jgi:CheY-like chemotaxis protein
VPGVESLVRLNPPLAAWAAPGSLSLTLHVIPLENRKCRAAGTVLAARRDVSSNGEEVSATSHAGFASFPSIVLVVHDDADTAEMYERLLELDDRELWVTSAIAREAIEYALDLRPDVILSDVGPGASPDGTEFLRQLADDVVLRQTPVVLVVSDPPPSVAIAHTVLVKPLEPDVLVASVRRAVQSARGQARRVNTVRHAVAARMARAARTLKAAGRAGA